MVSKTLGRLLVVAGLLFVASAQEALNATQLEINEEAQAKHEEPTEPVISQIVASADEVELESGDGDISTTGACSADIDHFCKDIKPGEGRLTKCLEGEEAEEVKGNVVGRTMSDECKTELRSYLEERATNINQDVVLATACKEDAEKYCNDSALYPEPGAVITCLREVEEKLTSTCKEQVTRHKLEAAKDYALDAMLHELCEDDAKTLCEGVATGEGRIQECLRSKRPSLSWDCQEELFRKEVEDADNLNLNVVLTRVCTNDKKKFCKDVKPGMGNAKKCLEDHRDEPDFSPECKTKFEEMMARRASDFRLDSKLRELCRDDIEEVCGYEKDSLDSIAGYDGRVIECLQDYKDELTASACKTQVHSLTERAAQDIRMDRPLADACYEDRQRLCAGVAPGSARVLRCLQDSRNQLTYECRATLFDQEVRLAEDIDFKYPMKKSCSKEIATLCKDVPHGHARIIGCLQEHDEHAEMTSECRAEVKRDEIRQAQDYRLNYRLNKACDSEIDMLCPDVCSPFQGQACGGTVLDCLKSHRTNITNDSCSKELFGAELMESKDWRTDAVLKDSCMEDVSKFCSDIEPGSGRVHNCLVEHRSELSDKCAKAEEKLNVIQSENVLLRPGFKACSEEMAVYCKGVTAGKGRMFRCLQQNVAKVDFSAACKEQVDKKQARMAGNWRMDYGVKHSCLADVNNLCASKKESGHGKGAVMKCLVENFSQISDGTCVNEVSRAVRMALWQYRRGAAMTLACDADAATCPKTAGIGTVGRCLSKRLTGAIEGKTLSEGCGALMKIAAPKDSKGSFDSNLATISFMQQISALEQQAGMNPTFVAASANGPSVTLTGWVALASIGALVLVVLGGIFYCYRKYTGGDKPYTLVVKGGDV